MSSLLKGVGRRDHGTITFLNGIARRRHHCQVRKDPWTRFFSGDSTTNKQTVAPPVDAHKW